jgi:hypothetical protein
VIENMYWTLSLLIHLWLLGSLVLPIMLLLRWSGAKWRGLCWLTRNRNRWISVWASFGFYKVIALAVLEVVKESRYIERSYYIGIDFLGWSGAVVSKAMPAFIHRMPDNLWLIVTLSALLNAAIFAGFGAAAWWAFERNVHKTLKRRQWSVVEKYYVGMLFSAWLLGIANNVYSRYHVEYGDIYQPFGFPFTYYYLSGGFLEIGRYVLKGIAADIALTVVLGAVLGWGWNWYSRRYSPADRTTI